MNKRAHISEEYIKTSKSLFNQAELFQKKTLTELRLPKQEELGNEIKTLVKVGDSVRVETVNFLTNETIIARNPAPILNKNNEVYYNEWLITKDVVAKNYGQEALDSLTTEFTSHKKKAIFKYYWNNT
jgi:hypothetical protein